MGGLLLLGLVALGGVFAVDWWVNAAKPPPAELRCGTCPKLAREVRSLRLTVWALVAFWVVTAAWGLAR